MSSNYVRNDGISQLMSDLTNQIKQLLPQEGLPVELEGTIFNLRQRDNYAFFDLNYEADKRLHVTIKGKPFSYFQRINLQDFQGVTLRGTLYLSERNGQFSCGVKCDWITRQQRRDIQSYSPKTTGIKPLPQMPPRIALLSSDESQGAEDFEGTLAPMLKSAMKKYNISTQGDRAVSEIVDAIRAVNTQCDADVICITRGGGDAILLHCVFDNDRLCQAILNSNIPVLIGVGHRSNKFQADAVSDTTGNFGTYAITPTDLANKLNERYKNHQFGVQDPYQQPIPPFPTPAPQHPQKLPGEGTNPFLLVLGSLIVGAAIAYFLLT